MDLSSLDAELSARLADLDAQHLRRRLAPIASPQGPHVVAGGRRLVNFSSNDYLGLATHPALVEAAARALRDEGAGSGASRLISGTLPSHGALETALAVWKRTEAALAFSSGMTTALGVIPALVGKGDVVILDKLAHACLVDGARLSGATLRVFRHNDLGQLEDRLRWAAARGGRVLVVTESVFSMDGDRAPLADLVSLKEQHGAWLLIDEAHAAGVIGATGAGLVEALDLHGRVEVQLGTLGKAAGASGGYVAGSRTLVDYLVNQARTFIFSTAPSPADAAAALAGLHVIQSDEGAARRTRLQEHLATLGVPHHPSAIVPRILGDEAVATRAAAHLREQGLWVPAIRYPTVARGTARLRASLSAAHETSDILTLRAALDTLGSRLA